MTKGTMPIVYTTGWLTSQHWTRKQCIVTLAKLGVTPMVAPPPLYLASSVHEVSVAQPGRIGLCSYGVDDELAKRDRHRSPYLSLRK